MRQLYDVIIESFFQCSLSLTIEKSVDTIKDLVVMFWYGTCSKAMLQIGFKKLFGIFHVTFYSRSKFCFLGSSFHLFLPKIIEFCIPNNTIPIIPQILSPLPVLFETQPVSKQLICFFKVISHLIHVKANFSSIRFPSF